MVLPAEGSDVVVVVVVVVKELLGIFLGQT